MRKVIKRIIPLVLIMTFIVTSSLIPVEVNAETAEGKIRSLVPDVEKYYPGIEDYIAKCLREYKTKIDITMYRVSVDNVPHVFKSAVFTNPDIFYVDASYIRYQFDSDRIVHYIIPDYTVKRSRIPAYIKKFNKSVKNFLSDIDSDLSDFRKALLIHDKMIINCQYKSSGDLSYTSYGALVNHKAVCEGYTRAYCYLLSKVGIESKCINNDDKKHCWNYVKIGNYWYHVDVTSDDPMPDTCGYVSHKYFLLNDSKLNSYRSHEHRGYKSDITYKTDYKCTNSRFNSSFFRNIKTEIVLYKNVYYFINNNYKGKHYSAFVSRKNNKNKTIMLIKDRWDNNKGKLYKNSFSKLCALDNQIYISTKRAIYRYKPNSGYLRRVFVMPEFWGNDFYGVESSGRYILANKKKSESSNAAKSKILYIRSDKSVLQLPFIRNSSVKIEQRAKYSFKVYRGSGKVKYISSNKRIAKVNSKGIVTALRKGSCIIKAIKNKKTFKLKVAVLKRAKKKGTA
ncbi:MAG: Ig-like domain-containing protein [Ruminococcus sp.]|nr:Ig-like domain-containing protein [Ruminococcus sp.]